jgi:hypothetical protein
MIDPTQLPLLLKAIDFVFEEGHRILKERRDRNKKDDSTAKDEIQEPVKELVPPTPMDDKETKQSLIDSKIDEILWQDHELEVQHLVKLLETYSKNYYLAREQYAKWGDALVPSIIVHNLQDAENSMIETTRKLEIVLSKIYKKEINPIQ